MSKSIQLMEPSKEALKWRDLDVKTQKQELALKIGLFAGAAILAIGVAVAIYFCATTTSTCINRAGETIVSSNAVLSILPAMFGGAGVIGMIVAGILINFERCRNGSNWNEDLSNPAIRDDRGILLTEGKLEAVYNQYYKKNGGLGPLVRRGFLTPDQGQELREIVKEYAANKTVMQNYESRTASFAKAVKTEPEKYPDYNSAKEKIAELEMSWENLRGEVAHNFTSV